MRRDIKKVLTPRDQLAWTAETSISYSVELTRATLDMHLFGPFMGFLYELIDALNRSCLTSTSANDVNSKENCPRFAVAKELHKVLVDTCRAISTSRGRKNPMIERQRKRFSVILALYQKQLRALMILESTLRNCVESFLDEILECGFSSVLIDIINNEWHDVSNDENLLAIQDSIRTTHVEASQLCIRILEWIEYNKSSPGRKVREWFGQEMDREWVSHFSNSRVRALLKMWELSQGSKYEWMAEREDAAETIQRYFKGYLVRKRFDFRGKRFAEEHEESNNQLHDDSSKYLQRSLTVFDGSETIAEEEEIEREWQSSKNELFDTEGMRTDDLEEAKNCKRSRRPNLLQRILRGGKVHQENPEKKVIAESPLSDDNFNEDQPTRKTTLFKIAQGLEDSVEDGEDSDLVDANKLMIARERILLAATEARKTFRNEKVVKKKAIIQDHHGEQESTVTFEAMNDLEQAKIINEATHISRQRNSQSESEE